MGLILDTSILIAAERRGGHIRDVITQARRGYWNADIGISAISVVELLHGVYRADNDARRERRRVFVERALDALIVYPATLEIAQLAGRIEGEQVSFRTY